MKNSVWLYIQSLGDGSVAVKFFSSEKAAEHYASFDDERLCDDIYEENLSNLEIDPVNWREEDEKEED